MRPITVTTMSSSTPITRWTCDECHYTTSDSYNANRHDALVHSVAEIRLLPTGIEMLRFIDESSFRTYIQWRLAFAEAENNTTWSGPGWYNFEWHGLRLISKTPKALTEEALSNKSDILKKSKQIDQLLIDLQALDTSV